jgi:hypothetical protein
MLVSSIVIEIKILLIDQLLDHFVHHTVIMWKWCELVRLYLQTLGH